MPASINAFHRMSAPPTATDHFYDVGDVVLNSAPASGGVFGWMCVTAGYPGTWKPIGVINQAGALTVTSAAGGTLSVGDSKVVINAANSFALPKAELHQAGFELVVKNINAGSVTLTAQTGNAYADATAITLTQNQFIRLIPNGTNWYKVG